MTAVVESEIQRSSKHVLQKSMLNGYYLFKIPCTSVAMVAGGFAGKLNGLDFRWNKHYIPGRQLMTVDRVQQLWPGKWEEFCTQLLPGFLDLRAAVRHRGLRDLDDHEKDCVSQVLLLEHLLITLLQDSSILLYSKDAQPNARIWRDLAVFGDPASGWMIWHATQLHPLVLQLQQQAEKIHYHVISHNGRETVMDQALAILHMDQAKTMNQAWDLHHKMVELLAGTAVPAAAVSLQPAVPVEAKPRALYLSNTMGDSLQLLWSQWDSTFRQYFGEAAEPNTKIEWADGASKSGTKFKLRLPLLLELDRQVKVAVGKVHCKAADKKAAAVKLVLSAWQRKMDSFVCVSAGGQQKPGISLAQAAAGFNSADSNKSSELITLQRGKTANPGSKIEVSRSAFLAHFCN